jgi:predicted RND superfamily exporter protein
MENGGNDVYFLSHLQSLYRFYTELKTAERVSQVRLPSPVDRLKELGETSVGTTKGVRQSRNRVLQQEIMSPTTGAKQGKH